jgi:hypothetical protein
MNVLSGFINLIIVVVALVIVYYSFGFFYGTSTSTGVVVQSDKVVANQGVKTFKNHPHMYEGGEYSVNFWLYVSGWNYKQGTRKHVLEIGGPNFSTLLVSMGAFKNTLSVRVDTHDASGSPITLSKANNQQFFAPLQSDNALTLDPSCNLDEIDLQRWVQVTVCLNGRTCDVYLDGKLARSCVLPGFFRVDAADSALTVVDRGGFDGYVSQVSAYNYALNPSAVYTMYMNGPSAASLDPWAYFTGLFKKQN